jgi:formate hydrogenlyase subunit 6/NADH:ubiquinone oxidoreductase subunit I
MKIVQYSDCSWCNLRSSLCKSSKLLRDDNQENKEKVPAEHLARKKDMPKNKRSLKRQPPAKFQAQLENSRINRKVEIQENKINSHKFKIW